MASSGNPTTAAPRPQPTVRVMRLYRPALSVASTSPFLTGEVAMTSPLSNFLLLPDSFGDLYVGETFRAYVALINTLDEQTLKRASLSIKIQANNSTCDLFDSAMLGGERDLASGESISTAISHLIADIGQHTLRVVVQYEDPMVSTSERVTMKKLYRFNVLSPLFISATVCESRHRPGNSLPVQISVTNATGQSMSLVSVEIDTTHASSALQVAPLAAHRDSAGHAILRLSPDESAAYGFKVVVDATQKPERIVLGRPVVVWENLFGEGGRFVGEEVSHSFPRQLIEAACPVRVHSAEVPPVVVVGEEFDLRLIVVATQYVPARKFKLRFKEESVDSVLLCVGKSSYDIPELQGSMTFDVTVALCATDLGGIDCNAFSLVDQLSGASYNLSMSCRTYSVTSLAGD